MLSAFMIVRDEEELLPYSLACMALLVDRLDVLSVVDNGSTDCTLDILYHWRDRLPLHLQHVRQHAHHGHLRTLALVPCRAPWIFYLDADETITRNFPQWLDSGKLEQADVWEFWKYTTIPDRYHHGGGDGPSQRLFRNRPGVHFPQSIHTEPTWDGAMHKQMAQGVWMFDHTHCASEEKLYAKGQRYQWAFRNGVPGVGPVHEYTGRSESARANGNIYPIPDNVRELIFTGPEPE